MSTQTFQFNVIKLLILVVFVAFSNNLFSQVSDQSTPTSFGFSTKSAKIIPSTQLDSVHVSTQKTKDVKQGIPNRYGVLQHVNIDICQQGTQSQYGNMMVWQYEISCPDAVSLGIFFQTYELPEGAAVYLYSPDKRIVRGGYTNFNNKASGQLAMADFPGNTVIIEYDEPVGADWQGGLVIGSVSRAYNDFQSSAARSRIQINCPEGADWQTEKRAVCRMTFRDTQYSYYCSGALINNVREDGTPYFLTANHCINTEMAARSLVTYFNYENSTCNSDDASLSESLSGADLIAHNTYSDFSLLKLSEMPPDYYSPYFAGWFAGHHQPQSGTCIHHPSGDPKCISIDYNPLTVNSYEVQWDDNTISEVNTHWEVFYDVGVDKSGSSGGPLFDQNKRIIGQLHGGDDVSSLFGMFSLSWNYNKEVTMQLKNWLDPDNTGTTTLDGVDYNSPPIADFSTDVNVACLSTPISLTDQSRYIPTGWLWKIEPAGFEFVDGTDEHSQNPKVRFTTEETYSITLVASNNNGSDTISYPNLVVATSTLPVAFKGLPDEMDVCGSDLTNYEMVAEGASDYTFSVTASDNFELNTNGNILTLNLKDAVRQYGSFDTYVKVTGTHGDCSASDSVLLHVLIPKNDDVQHAIALGLGNNGTFSNQCGTAQINEPNPPTAGCNLANNWCPPTPGTTTIDNSIWFTFKGTSNGKLTIQTKGFDTQIAVYDANSTGDLLSGNSSNYTLVAASDNSSSGSEAALEDIPVKLGQTYYLQVDGKDGAYGDLTVNLLGNTIEVYPNPSNNVFHLTVSSLKSGEAQLAVYSLSGQQILTQTTQISPNDNTVDLDLSGNPAGLYLFRAEINGMVLTKKLMLTKN